MTSHGDSGKEGDQRSFSRTASVADVALIALNNLDRAVAVVGADANIVFRCTLMARACQSGSNAVSRAPQCPNELTLVKRIRR
jgi:hypothetical protein